MSIVLQHDSRANVTYAYHNTVIWDKVQKKSSTSRILIGKVDPETGEVVKTSGNRRKKQIDDKTIDSEIAEFNKKVREKKNMEEALLSGNSLEIMHLKEELARIQHKYKQVSQIMLSATSQIRQILEDNTL
jgi:hypothetical protein